MPTLYNIRCHLCSCEPTIVILLALIHLQLMSIKWLSSWSFFHSCAFKVHLCYLNFDNALKCNSRNTSRVSTMLFRSETLFLAQFTRVTHLTSIVTRTTSLLHLFVTYYTYHAAIVSNTVYNQCVLAKAFDQARVVHKAFLTIYLQICFCNIVNSPLLM